MTGPGRMPATLFGALMVGTAAVAAAGPARIGAGLALAAVLAGIVHRPAAVAAVLATVALLAWSSPPVVVAAACGLSATAYLVLRYGPGAGDVVVPAVTVPTLLGMGGGTLAALAASVLPWRIPWLPLLAPVIVVGIVVLAGAGLFRADPVRYE